MRGLLLALLVSPGVSDPGGGADERSFRYHYANDLFAGSDYYFTQGMGLRWTDPLLRTSPLALPLPGWGADAERVSVSWRYEGYTPVDFGDPEIQVGDRPFASYMYLGHRSERRAEDGHAALAAQWSLGYLGPAVGGGEFQTAIHRVTGDRTPLGWRNQLRHDLVAQLDATYARRVLDWSGRLEVWTEAQGRAGTLRTDASLLGRVRAGRLDGPAGGVRGWLWLSAGGRAVAFDATLQGGVLSESPHALSGADVRRLVAEGQLGVALGAGPVEVTLGGSRISAELAGGRPHAWGQLSLAARY